jgi:hypothetical protein
MLSRLQYSTFFGSENGAGISKESFIVLVTPLGCSAADRANPIRDGAELRRQHRRNSSNRFDIT